MYRTKLWIPNPHTRDRTLVPFPDTCVASTPTGRASVGTGAWQKANPAPRLLPGGQSLLPHPGAQMPSRPQLRDPRPIPSPPTPRQPPGQGRGSLTQLRELLTPLTLPPLAFLLLPGPALQIDRLGYRGARGPAWHRAALRGARGPGHPGHRRGRRSPRGSDPPPPAAAEGGAGPERGSPVVELPTPGQTCGRTDSPTARPPPFPLPDRPGPGSPAARPPACGPAAPHITGLPPSGGPGPAPAAAASSPERQRGGASGSGGGARLGSSGSPRGAERRHPRFRLKTGRRSGGGGPGEAPRGGGTGEAAAAGGRGGGRARARAITGSAEGAGARGSPGWRMGGSGCGGRGACGRAASPSPAGRAASGLAASRDAGGRAGGG